MDSVVLVVGGASRDVVGFCVVRLDVVVSGVLVRSTVVVGSSDVNGSESDVGVGFDDVLGPGAAGAGLFGLSSQTASATRPATTIPPMIAGRF